MRHKTCIPLHSVLLVLFLVGFGIVSGVPGFDDIVHAAGSTNRITIPAAAFQPWTNGQVYKNHARYLEHLGPGNLGTRGDYWYLAPLYLPDGATINKLVFHWYVAQVSFNGVGQLKLQKTELGKGSYMTLALVETPGTPGNHGYGSTFTTAIDQPVVDNSLYTYWLVLHLPVSGYALSDWFTYVYGAAAQVEYTYPLHLPLIRR
jgi:hypothetical protein